MAGSPLIIYDSSIWYNSLREGVQQTAQKIRAMSSGFAEALARLKTMSIPDDEKLKEEIETVQQEVEKLHDENKNLVHNMSELSDEIDSLAKPQQEKLLHLENELAELREKCKTQEDQQTSLKVRIKELEEKNMKIHLAQATWLFERYVARFVLPETVNVGLFGGYKLMSKHIKEKDNKVKLNWSRVLSNSNVKWENHWEAIEDLREARKPVAHPKVNFKQAIKEISEMVPQYDKECRDIIQIVVTVNSLMQVGNLACKLKEMKMKASKRGRQNKDEASEWENLINGMEWSSKHDQALDEMTKLKRKVKDLQDIDLEEAKIHLVGYVPKELEKESHVIVDILKKL